MSEIWNLSSLCRCCHSDGTFKSLYLSYVVKGQREQYAEMLKDTFDIVMDPAPPNASTMVCDDCIYELKKATRFKKQVLDCERKFAEYCLNEQTNQLDVKIECESEDNSDGDRALREKDSELESAPRDAGKSGRGGKKRRVRMSRNKIGADTNKDAISTMSIDDDMDTDNCHDNNNAADKRPFLTTTKPITEEPKTKASTSQIDSSILNLLLAKMDMLVESTRTQHERTMESIKALQDGQREMQDTQQAIIQNLSKNETQIKQLKSVTDIRVPTTPLVKTAEDLKRLESLLADPVKEEELRRKYSVICGVGKGRGINSAYSLIDAIFERSFLDQCSWAGGSRSAESKICFKSCTNVIDFFFRLVHMSDKSFTMVDCHEFLKSVLRNSRKRCESLMLRKSTLKNRMRRRRDQSAGKVEPREAIDIILEATAHSPEGVQSRTQADDAWSEGGQSRTQADDAWSEGGQSRTQADDAWSEGVQPRTQADGAWPEGGQSRTQADGAWPEGGQPRTGAWPERVQSRTQADDAWPGHVSC